MMLKFGKTWLYCFFLPLFFDRLTKYLVTHGVWQNQEITSFFELYLTYNRGISWGMGNGESQVVFVTISLLVALVLMLFAWHVLGYLQSSSVKLYVKSSSLFVLSGALSNLMDRVLYGGVVDFILLHWHDWSFPIFNVADVYISMGMIVLLYAYLVDDL